MTGLTALFECKHDNGTLSWDATSIDGEHINEVHCSVVENNKIRNYVLHPYKMVKDLRTNYESSSPESVLDGDLNPFIKSYLMEFGRK